MAATLDFNQEYHPHITVDAGVDISAGSAIILFKRPDGAKGSWAASSISGTVATYDIPDSTIINMEGIWEFQVKYTLSGAIGYSPITYYKIKKNLGITANDPSATPGLEIWGFDQQVFERAQTSGTTVTITNTNKPASIDEILVLTIEGARYSSTGGDITYTYASPVITFSESITGLLIVVDYRYLITTL